MSEKTAVLMLQMGGPDSTEAIEPFLCNLFSDRDIIRIGPSFFQPLIARFIARRRAKKVKEYYKKIGGKSPLRELTEQQALELDKVLGNDYRCFVGMRYWKPETELALAAIQQSGIKKIVALSLYPHYSMATSGSSFNQLDRIVAGQKGVFELKYIRQFYNHPLYITALVEKIEKALSTFDESRKVMLLFSAHGLPQSFIDAGDPYLSHIQETVRLVMGRFERYPHKLAFQSRAGPVKWLEPSTEDAIASLAAAGCKDVLVVPISFVSDHIETLYEIDIQYAEEANKLGITNFKRCESLNSSPAFIKCLAEIVHEAML